ncbi:uncharacterized protein BDR25DRAFT_113162 [Lindgomyces ingoldianus]|uniref:Uncharacterized protein n=1 Tax=Lindgomyces ingoldianus TaxID=673940 RepID=A0ACB6R838_9PLEO|nr:uncharacterized protein BDR25DRAFT_113162 [Lindgomyces ingoldianus]KAF2474953.1 hypothetical protein BDR25DRAFT_113162 [Lindgomyces ingoldianus]
MPRSSRPQPENRHQINHSQMSQHYPSTRTHPSTLTIPIPNPHNFQWRAPRPPTPGKPTFDTIHDPPLNIPPVPPLSYIEPDAPASPLITPSYLFPRTPPPLPISSLSQKSTQRRNNRHRRNSPYHIQTSELIPGTESRFGYGNTRRMPENLGWNELKSPMRFHFIEPEWEQCSGVLDGRDVLEGREPCERQEEKAKTGLRGWRFGK